MEHPKASNRHDMMVMFITKRVGQKRDTFFTIPFAISIISQTARAGRCRTFLVHTPCNIKLRSQSHTPEPNSRHRHVTERRLCLLDALCVVSSLARVINDTTPMSKNSLTSHVWRFGALIWPVLPLSPRSTPFFLCHALMSASDHALPPDRWR